MTTERERTRRELRALAAVNRQLHARLDEPVRARPTRRSDTAAGWIEELRTIGQTEPCLVRDRDGAVFVIEGERKRPVRSGILAAALEDVLGAADEPRGRETVELDEGVPVELLEPSKGMPFVVVGGKRCEVSGIPLPFAVEDLQASEFPEGEPINVAAANISRRRFDEAVTGHFQIDRARRALGEKGLVGTAKAVARRVRSRGRRALRR